MKSPMIAVVTLLGAISAEAQAPNWTLGARPNVDVGLIDGAPEYLLSRVTHVLPLANSTLLIADASGLRQYDGDGKYVRTFAPRGSGPGEIRFVGGLRQLSDHTLAVWDWGSRSRMLFDSAGKYLSQERMLTEFDNPRVVSFEFSWLATDSTLLSRTEPAHQPRAGEVDRRPWRFVLAHFRGGRVTELGVFRAQASLLLSGATSSGPARHAWQPFSPITHAAAGAGRIYIGDSAKPEISVYNATDGSYIGALPFRQPPLPVRPADLDYELQRRLSANPADIHPEIRRLWSLAPKPDRFPFYGGFVPDTDGNLWVMTYRARHDVASMWHVLSSTSAELGRIRMPARFQPMFITREHVVGIAKDENDVEYVQVWAYTRSH